MNRLSFHLALLALLFNWPVFTSCTLAPGSHKLGTHKKKTSNSDAKVDSVESIPEWVVDSLKACSQRFKLCASGEGETLAIADLHAREAVAAIFESKIESTLTDWRMEMSRNLIPDESVQEVSRDLKQTISQVLKGSEISKRALYRGVYFSLAVLDKQSSREILKGKIATLDEQMQVLYKQHKRTLYFRLMELFKKRQLLEERLQFLDGKTSVSPVTLSQIRGLRSLKSSAPKTILMKFSFGNKVSVDQKWAQLLSNKLAAMLSSLGHRVATASNSKNSPDLIIEGKMKVQPEYLRINGFKKYSFEFGLFAKNSAGQKLGGIQHTEISTGRSLNDAYQKVKAKLTTYMENHIEDLNID